MVTGMCPWTLKPGGKLGSRKTELVRRTSPTVPKFSQRKAIKPLMFIPVCPLHRSQLKTFVARHEAAAIPVVYGLHAGILQFSRHKVVTAIGRQIEPLAAGFADLNKGRQQLALEGLGGARPEGDSSRALSRAWPMPTVARQSCSLRTSCGSNFPAMVS